MVVRFTDQKIMNISPQFILMFVTVCLLSSPALGKDLGQAGQCYPIREKDALIEMTDRVSSVNWSSVMDKKKMTRRVKDYRPEGLKNLPHAQDDRSYTVDMTYTTEFDIPNPKGGILYPKGYRFNPLDHMFLSTILVFIDGSDSRQISWFTSSPYAKRIDVMLLLVDGAYYDLMEALSRPVFYANHAMTSRFGVKATPAVAMQKGRVMHVYEYTPDTRRRGKR
jgi:conjugal transfer pilus assembly protein TraW